jgi:signal transduction histidine kinase
MKVERIKQQALFSWVAVGLLGTLCCVLAILQYRWIGEISSAEQARLRASLQSSLNRLKHDFELQLASACVQLIPKETEIEASGREGAYLNRYLRWKKSGGGDLFRNIALAIPAQGEIQLLLLDKTRTRFVPEEWTGWSQLHAYLQSRLNRGPETPNELETTTLIEIPRFGPPRRNGIATGPAEQEWLVVEVDLEYVSKTVMPRLLERHLAAGGRQEYNTRVHWRRDPSRIIYASDTKALAPGADADGTITLLEAGFPDLGRRLNSGTPIEEGIDAGSDSGRGRWTMVVRHETGSLAAIVARARRRNLLVSAGLFVLMLGTGAALVRFSRQAHKLAELQINFVAGVSHELRTPLTVIRTAAYNLQGRVAGNPSQVERYGALIQTESERLTAMVEEVLSFANARAGRVINKREPLSVNALIEQVLESSGVVLRANRFFVEKRVEEDLPLILGDEAALSQAIRNLIDNAVKYGTEADSWIGISARQVAEGSFPAVEIRVADHGAGIPPDEQQQIFDAFYRGRRAVEDQIHGTGLGLNLVKQIVEAHGGSVRVHSEPGNGSEFVLTIPAAPSELRNEFTHSVDRG